MAKGDSKQTDENKTTESTKLSKDAPASYTTSANMDNPESASATPATKGDPDGPNAEDDRKALDEQARRGHPGGIEDLGRAVKVDKDPSEAQENDADWEAGRDPKDVVEVEGQRETVEARMARNGVYSPEKQAGAGTKPKP